MQSLNFAVRDAQEISHWLKDKAKFEKVYLFTDNSLPISDMTKEFPSQPTYTTLLRWIGRRFKKQPLPQLSFGDNLWFFFSGHGWRHSEQDYLLLADSDPSPEHIERTAISINYITERLRQCGAGNVILFIDACRESAKGGNGLSLTSQQGIISIASCSPNELSYEIKDLQHGSFTYALLESLDIQGEGNCATVERLTNRLRTRVKEINRHYEKPPQTTYEVVQPASKYHLILLPSQATDNDVTALKLEAYKAEDEDKKLAEKLWTQVLVASPADLDALMRLKKIWLDKEHQSRINALQKSLAEKESRITQLEQQLEQECLQGPKHQAYFPFSFPFPFSWRVGLGLGVTIALPFIAYYVFSISNNHLKPVMLCSSPNGSDIPQPPSLILKTTRVDYTSLCNLLKARKWKKADQETTRAMLQAADRVGNGGLTIEDIDKFPCEDLRIIDQLWLKSSQENFGFSVQKGIYQKLRESNKDIEDWKIFGNLVGWRDKKEGVWYEHLAYANDAPKGQLPWMGRYIRYSKWHETGTVIEKFFSRTTTCNL